LAVESPLNLIQRALPTPKSKIAISD
jgi:hypothetical protein